VNKCRDAMTGRTEFEFLYALFLKLSRRSFAQGRSYYEKQLLKTMSILEVGLISKHAETANWAGAYLTCTMLT
jgi:hypothetical protein